MQVSKNIQKKLDSIFALAASKTVEEGTVLYSPGSAINDITLLISGSVEQVLITQAGQEIKVHQFEPGAVMPLMLILNDEENPFHFITTSTCELMKIPVEVFIDHLNQDKELLKEFLKRFALATNGLAKRVAFVAGNRQKDQLLFLLRFLALKQNQDSEDHLTLDPIPTHVELSKWLGSARETVSRLMSQLQNDGVITIKNKQLTFLKENFD